MDGRYRMLIIVLFTLVLISFGKAEATDDNFTFTKIELTYSDASVTTINDLNLSTIFHPQSGYTNTLVLSNSYNIPDGTITSLTIRATYTLGDGMGSGDANWTPNTGLPITVSGSRRITISFYFDPNPGPGWYYPSSVASE